MDHQKKLIKIKIKNQKINKNYNNKNKIQPVQICIYFLSFTKNQWQNKLK